jgi:orotidine-5'-phosphate decarboxylase
VCVGIDPSPALLAHWGLGDDAGGLRAFSSRCVEALAGVVPVVKPQVAFFERHGSAGMAVLETVVAEAMSAGLIVIADAKRGDVGSTVEAYADAWLRGPFAADALTAHPYLGLGSLAPMVTAARETGRGVLVVVASSNPEGRTVQEAVTADGRTVEESLLAEIGVLNREEVAGADGAGADGAGADGGAVSVRGAVGAVVGATRAPAGVPLSSIGGVLLAPGVGAQGATPRDVARLFEGCPPGSVLPSVSRSVLAAGPGGLRDAAQLARDELAAAIR